MTNPLTNFVKVRACELIGQGLTQRQTDCLRSIVRAVEQGEKSLPPEQRRECEKQRKEMAKS